MSVIFLVTFEVRNLREKLRANCELFCWEIVLITYYFSFARIDI